tara:strand:- start:253 stop:429 length:177 start_codon:yes stop_codon:yes gene_type:complete
MNNFGHYKKLHSKSILLIIIFNNLDRRIKMTLKINSVAPDFKAKTSEGDISFHEWLGR